jgi:hypothetical protein
MLPQSLVEPLKRHLENVQIPHNQDLEEGFGEVYLPFALERKHTNTSHDWDGSTSFPLAGARLTRAAV